MTANYFYGPSVKTLFSKTVSLIASLGLYINCKSKIFIISLSGDPNSIRGTSMAQVINEAWAPCFMKLPIQYIGKKKLEMWKYNA